MSTPILFLVFNRPDLTRRVFETIRLAKPAQLFIAADGPRAHKTGEAELCEQTRAICRKVDWDCEVHTLFRDENLGCKRAVSGAITWFFEQVEEGIILEDDCLPCPDFFTFCSAMLDRYRGNPRLMHIGGANFQAGKVRGKASYYFSRFVHVWGWASWRRAWRHYDVAMLSWPEAKADNWLSKLRADKLEREYWKACFDKVHAGELDTWDYQWAYACWRRAAVAIVPNMNLITNIGAGPDATHTKGPVGSLAVSTGTLGELRHPKDIFADFAADKFTFDEHCGGNAMRREKNPFIRARRELSKLKSRMLNDAAAWL